MKEEEKKTQWRKGNAGMGRRGQLFQPIRLVDVLKEIILDPAWPELFIACGPK